MKTLHIAFYTLFQRKKWLLLLLGITSLTIAAVVSVFTATESIRGSLLEKSYAKYGQHHSVLINADPTTKHQLLEMHEVDTVGEFSLVGTVFIDEQQTKEATVGWFSEEAVRLGHLNLKEGRMPLATGEVAIEAHYAQASDADWAIGERTTLQIDGEDHELLVVGIVSNYSSQWSTDFDVVRGVNDYPNIFLSEEDVQTYDHAQTNLLISFDGSIKQASNRANELHQHIPNESPFENHRLFYEGLNDYEKLSSLTLIFQGMIILASVLSLLNLFSFYFISQRQKIAIFQACGATQKQLYLIVLLQSLMIFLVSSALAIPLISGAHQLFVALTYGEGNMESIRVIWVLLWMIVLFSSVVTTALWSVFRKRHSSISNMLKDDPTPHSNGNGLESYFERAPFWLRKVYIQIIQSWKQSVGSIVCLSVIMCIVFIAFFLVRESTEVTAEDDEDYLMTTQVSYSFETMHGLFVLGADVPGSGELVFAPKEVDRLEQLPGIQLLDKVPFMVDVHPLLTDNQLTPTMQAEANLYLQAEEDDIPSRESLGMPEHVTAIPHVEYLLVDQQEYEDIYAQYFGGDSDYDSFANNQLLMFLPEEMEDAQQLLALKGETIQFGQLRREDAETFTFHHWNYKVQNVYIGPFRRTVTDNIHQERDGIVMVMDREGAANNHLFKGYNSVALHLENDVSAEEKAYIEQLSRDLVASVPGSYFMPGAEFIKEEQRIVSFLKTLALGMFILTLIYLAVSIVAVIFSRFIVRRKEWGIYFATGMNRNMMRFTVLGELFVYWLIATIVSLPICILSIIVMPSSYPWSQYFIDYLFVVLCVFVALLASGIALTRLIARHSILSLLRVTE